jgi:hypothetical protein
MKALTPGATDYVIVGGYYEKGDGKAIEKYWYDSTLVFADEPDNGGTIIQPLSVPAQGGWRGIIKGVLNPYQFGAYGDKTTDDILPINACITAAKNLGHRKIYLRSGDYAISTSINLKTLLGITDVDTVQGYFQIEGENPKTTRLIPKSNINGGMIELVNAGTGNAANARQITIKNLGFYADNVNNAWARYGIWFRWVAEVYYENLLFHNCVTKRAIYHDVVFVVSMKNIDGKGKEGNYIDSGQDGVALIESNFNAPQEVSEACTFSNSSGTLLVTYTTDFLDGAVVKFSGGTNPTGISSNTDYYLTRISATTAKLSTSSYNYRNGTFIAYTDAGAPTITIRNSESDKMTGLFTENTSTTTKVDTCRFSNYIYNITFGGGDLLQVKNCAPESAKYHGILVNGSTASVNIIGNYFEGISGTYMGGTQATSINLKASCDNVAIENNFFNDDYVIALGGDAQMNSLRIVGNHFLTSDVGIQDNGAALNNVIIKDNDFKAGVLDFVLQANTSDTRYKIDFANNLTITNYFDRYDINLNRFHLNEWIASGATIALSANRFNNQDAYNIAGSGGDIISKELMTIETARNLHLRSKWITLEIPVVAITGTTASVIRIDDGIVSRDYNLRAVVGTWNTRRAYFPISATATKLEVRIYPTGDNITVCNPVIRQGLWGDDFAGQQSFNSVVVRPDNAIESVFTLYDRDVRTIKMVDVDYAGTPSYPVVTINGPSGISAMTLDGSQGLKMSDTRIQGAKGSDVVSANDTTLAAGNYFDITGATTINGIAITNWQAGSLVTLQFDSTPTVKHNTVASAGFASILLAGAADFVASANDILMLQYDGTTWREVSRTVI